MLKSETRLVKYPAVIDHRDAFIISQENVQV